MMQRKLYCAYDDEGVYVYMALNPSIVQLAVEGGAFGKNFAFDLTRWIKPSFAWMVLNNYNRGKNRMLAIARVKLHHWAWLEMLEQTVQSHYDDEIHLDRMAWKVDLKRAKVICQWDLERGLDGLPLERKGIQLGLRAAILPDFAQRYVISVEDVSPLAAQIAQVAKTGGTDFPAVLEERLYPLEAELATRLGCTE